MNTEDKKIFANFEGIFDVDRSGDKHPHTSHTLTIGVVVDTDDPLQNGRLRIFCPSWNDDPKKLQHLPWAAYVSPFGGRVNNSCFTRGTDASNATSDGAVNYGFWGIPEQGAHVLVGCIDGDSRRRYWLGCFSVDQETHTLFNGRFKWSGFDGTPDGPFSSSNAPIQPLYDNLTDAFVDRTSREWKTRGADYQPTAVSQDVGQPPNSGKDSYLDDQNAQITAAEPDSWVKSVLGAHGYDWTSFKNLGAFLASKVFGITTPGMHSLMMDDRPFNCRQKFRTTSGHMILMDDTNERIYIMTNKGNNWVELDSSGNIDVYSARRVSIHAAQDINFSTEGTFRVKATQGIYMYAGDTAGTPIDGTPPAGQIRLQSSDDLHIYSNANIRQYSEASTFIESEADINVSSDNWYQQATSLIGSHGDTISFEAISAVNASCINSLSALEVNPSAVVLQGDTDVYIASTVTKASINLINSTFLTKEDGSGAEMSPISVPTITPPTISANLSDAQISIWTNRVPQHEPWPRTLMQDSSVAQNSQNTGYQRNVDWIPQFDNTSSPQGMQPIGVVEGDETITRGEFWRR